MNRKLIFSMAVLITLALSMGMVVPLVAAMTGIHTNVSRQGSYAPVEYAVYPFIFFALGVVVFYLYALVREIHEALVLSAGVWPLYLWIDLWLLNFTIVSGHRSDARLELELAGIAAIFISGVYLARKNRAIVGDVR